MFVSYSPGRGVQTLEGRCRRHRLWFKPFFFKKVRQTGKAELRCAKVPSAEAEAEAVWSRNWFAYVTKCGVLDAEVRKNLLISTTFASFGGKIRNYRGWCVSLFCPFFVKTFILKIILPFSFIVFISSYSQHNHLMKCMVMQISN